MVNFFDHLTPSVLDVVAGTPTYPQTSPGKSDHSTGGGEEGITEVVAILAGVGLAHIGGDKTNLCKKVPLSPHLNKMVLKPVSISI